MIIGTVLYRFYADSFLSDLKLYIGFGLCIAAGIVAILAGVFYWSGKCLEY